MFVLPNLVVFLLIAIFAKEGNSSADYEAVWSPPPMALASCSSKGTSNHAYKPRTLIIQQGSVATPNKKFIPIEAVLKDITKECESNPAAAIDMRKVYNIVMKKLRPTMKDDRKNTVAINLRNFYLLNLFEMLKDMCDVEAINAISIAPKLFNEKTIKKITDPIIKEVKKRKGIKDEEKKKKKKKKDESDSDNESESESEKESESESEKESESESEDESEEESEEEKPKKKKKKKKDKKAKDESEDSDEESEEDEEEEEEKKKKSKSKAKKGKKKAKKSGDDDEPKKKKKKKRSQTSDDDSEEDKSKGKKGKDGKGGKKAKSGKNGKK